MLIRLTTSVILLLVFFILTTSVTYAETPTGLGAGYFHTCVFTSDGVKCWGYNGRGGLGDGTVSYVQPEGKSIPVSVIGISDAISSVDGGFGHTCVLTVNGAVKCWGSNGKGELGDGTITSGAGPTPYSKPSPVNVVGLSSGVTQISLDREHSCALLTSGNLKCWGANIAGALGDGSYQTNRSSPVDVVGLDGLATAVSVGADFTCALLESGGVQCWGITHDGRLGNGRTTADPSESHNCIDCQTRPVDVVGLDSGVVALTTGGYFACALLSTGDVKCWGGNYTGQLGDGTTTNSSTPVTVVGLDDDVLEIAAGNEHVCALLANKTVQCWGNNSDGNLGNGGVSQQEPYFESKPVDVVGLPSSVSKLVVGNRHNCVILDGSAVKCWGFNQYGGLGNSTFANSPVPTYVWGFENIAPVATGLTINNSAEATNQQNVSVAMSATDNVGIYQVRYSNDGSTWGDWRSPGASDIWNLSSGDGTKTVRVQVRDGALNVSNIVSASIVLDTINPVGSVEFSGETEYTRFRDVMLELVAEDDRSGIVSIGFSQNGSTWSDWENFDEHKALTLSDGDETKIVYARVMDNAGNVSSPFSASITLDTVPPTVAVTPLSDYIASLSIPVTWLASDATSGIMKYDVDVSVGDASEWLPWLTATTTITAVYPGVDGQIYRFRIRAYDNANNVSVLTDESETITIVDVTQPQITEFDINGGALGSTVRDVILDIQATDTTSKVSAISLSNDETIWSEWQAFNGTATWQLSEGDSPKTVYLRVRDDAGNISTIQSNGIVLDTTTGDSYGVSINSGNLFTNDTQVSLSLGAAMGTAQMMVANDGNFADSDWEPFATQKEWQITQYGTSVLPRLVYVRFKDVEGDLSPTFQDDIILDVTPPTGTVEVQQQGRAKSASQPLVQVQIPTDNPLPRLYLPMLAHESCGSGTDRFVLEFRAQDDASGVDNVLISPNSDFSCPVSIPYSGTPTIAEWLAPQGTTHVHVRFRDNAGNVSEVITRELQP